MVTSSPDAVSDVDIYESGAIDYDSGVSNHADKPEQETESTVKPVSAEKGKKPADNYFPGNGNFEKATRDRVTGHDQVPDDEIEDFNNTKASEIINRLQLQGMKVSGNKVEMWNRLKKREPAREPKKSKPTTVGVRSNGTKTAGWVPGNNNFKKASVKRTLAINEIPNDEMRDFLDAKVADIKEGLRTKGMVLSGKKAELWNRLHGREAAKSPKDSNFRKATLRRTIGRDQLAEDEREKFDNTSGDKLKEALREYALPCKGPKIKLWERLKTFHGTHPGNGDWKDFLAELDSDTEPEPDTETETESESESESEFELDSKKEESDVEYKTAKFKLNDNGHEPFSLSPGKIILSPGLKWTNQLEHVRDDIEHRDGQLGEMAEPDAINEGGTLENNEGIEAVNPIDVDDEENYETLTEESRKRHRRSSESSNDGHISKRRRGSFTCLRGGTGDGSDEGIEEDGEIKRSNYYIHIRWLDMTIAEIRAAAPGAVHDEFVAPHDDYTFSEYLQRHTEQRVRLAKLRQNGESPLQDDEDDEVVWANRLPEGLHTNIPFVDVLDSAPRVWQLMSRDGCDDLWDTSFGPGPRDGWHRGILDNRRFFDVIKVFPHIVEFFITAIEEGELQLENEEELIFLEDTLTSWKDPEHKIWPYHEEEHIDGVQREGHRLIFKRGNRGA